MNTDWTLVRWLALIAVAVSLYRGEWTVALWAATTWAALAYAKRTDQYNRLLRDKVANMIEELAAQDNLLSGYRDVLKRFVRGDVVNKVFGEGPHDFLRQHDEEERAAEAERHEYW
jgi:F420-0:gamma-glutamyl ligase